MKRLIAGLLCAVMITTLLPVNALAGTNTKSGTTEFTGSLAETENNASGTTVSDILDSVVTTDSNVNLATEILYDTETSYSDSASIADISESSPIVDAADDAMTEIFGDIGEDSPSNSEQKEEESGSEQNNEESGSGQEEAASHSTDLVDASGGAGRQMYLSDYSSAKMPRCEVGWGTYTRDANLDGKPITLLVNNAAKVFDKGVTAHATATLVYDLKYTDYDYFESYIGVDYYRYTNGQVKFSFYLSTDNANWVEQDFDGKDTAFRGNTNAAFVKFSVNGYRYLKVVIDKDGADTADHSTLAGARVYTTDYVKPTVTNIHEASYYSSQIAGKTYSEILASEELEMALLRYRFMTLIDVETLTYALTSCDNSAERISAYNWIFNDYEALKELMNGGKPQESNYVGALDVLADLYATYSNDLKNTEALRSPDSDHTNDTKGDLYRRMMLTMSLVCANGFASWLARTGYVNPVNRYAYFKENYDNEKMRDEIFENLGVDEMRWVIGNNVSDAEIVWLNDYARAHPRSSTQTGYPIIYSPHHHIQYRWYNYDKDEFYADENKETYTTKYMLTGYEKYGLTYGLTNGLKVQRVWMVFEDGAVCGNISRTGANLAASFGVPACEVGQPGHAAFAIMNLDSNGNMIWGIDNDISGWTQSSNSRRMPADWGNVSDSWSSGLKAQYILLSQAALDDLDNYSKAEEVMMLYDLAETFEQKEACCRAALAYMPFHLDAWLALVQLYTGTETITATQLTALADELCSADTKLYLYPKAMYDLMQLILTRLNDILDSQTEETDKILTEAEIARCNMILQAGYERAITATSDDCTQPSVSRYIAQSFLSSNTYNLCTFSFDGDDAGTLVFDSTFTSVRFRYCLNYTDDDDNTNDTWIYPGVVTSTDGTSVKYKLSDEEIASITSSSDILIWLDGWPSSNGDGSPVAADAYSIDITDGTVASGLDFNDNENTFMGDVTSAEYSLDNGTTWADLGNDTLFPGDNTIIVRRKAYGTVLQGDSYTYYSVTNNSTDRAYIPISRLVLAAYSSEETSKNDYAKYAIDGKYTTRWHTLWNGSDTEKYITIKTTEPTYFTGLTYTPVGGNGTITAGQIYVSTDGTSWIPVKTISGWADNTDVKSVSFTATYGQYLKLEVTASHGNFVSARKIELFENTTLKDKEVTGVSLITLPTKRTYERGEKLDLTGTTVKLVYADNTYSILPVEMLTANVDILNNLGTIEVKLSYGSFAPVRFHVTVNERELTATSIDVVRLPDQVEYYAGDSIDTSGMVVTATDGTTTVYLDEDEYEVSYDFAEEGVSTVTVRLKDTEITDTFTVGVKRTIKSLTVTSQPTRQTYELGDALETAGLEITATYADGIQEVLDDSQYIIDNADTFSEEDGEITLPVSLIDKHSIQTQFTVRVFPYYTENNIRYSVDVKTHTCYVISITSTDAFISIPESIRLGSRTYTVTGIGSNVMSSTSTVQEVSLPGTITDIKENAFSDCDALKKVYLTAHTGFSDLSVADNSFNTDVEIVLYAATDDLSDELKTKSYAQDLGVDNISGEIASIKVTPPTQTTISMNQTPDYTGYSVSAVLNNGTVVPLNISTCTESPAAAAMDTSAPGSYPVTITLTGTALSDSFTITVQASTLAITENPESALYTTTTGVIDPLSVAATSNNESDVFEYQWYYSATDSPDTENDIISGATEQTYTPDKTGYYYAKVTIRNTDIHVYSMLAKISIGDYAAIIGSDGYDSLSAAVNDAASGAVIELMKDVTLSSGISFSKSLTILGNDHSVTRGKGFTGTMFTISGGTFTASNLILDGGAGWTGEIHSQLLRGCESSGTIAYGPIIRASGSAQIILGQSTYLQNNYNMATATKSTTAGAIYAEGTAKIELTGVSITDNYSFLFGSAIYHRDNTTLTINEGCFIHGNSGSEQWNTSAICVDNNGICTVNGGTFCHNVGAAKGGVFWVSNGSLTINGGTFTDNVSSGGATMYLNGSANVTINGYDAIEDIYLTSGKSINIGGTLPANSLNIITADTTTGTEFVKPINGVTSLDVQDAITVNGDEPGLNSSGNLTLPCSSHTPSAWKTKRAATCSVAGIEYKCCETCGAQIETREISCLDHTPVNVAQVDAGCLTDGTTAGTMCSVCGQTLSGMETIKAHGHEWSNTCIKAATCTTEGEFLYTCNYCSESYTMTTDRNGHDMEVTITEYPSYLAVGHELHKCKNCDESYELEIPMLESTLGDINMDGVVNMKDVVRLMKYQLGETNTVNTLILDINGDKTNDTKDLIRLLKYNSGETVELFR